MGTETRQGLQDLRMVQPGSLLEKLEAGLTNSNDCQEWCDEADFKNLWVITGMDPAWPIISHITHSRLNLQNLPWDELTDLLQGRLEDYQKNAYAHKNYLIPMLLCENGNHWISAFVDVKPDIIRVVCEDTFEISNAKIEHRVNGFRNAIQRAFKNSEYRDANISVEVTTSEIKQEDTYSCGYRAVQTLYRNLFLYEDKSAIQFFFDSSNPLACHLAGLVPKADLSNLKELIKTVCEQLYKNRFYLKCWNQVKSELRKRTFSNHQENKPYIVKAGLYSIFLNEYFEPEKKALINNGFMEVRWAYMRAEEKFMERFGNELAHWLSEKDQELAKIIDRHNDHSLISLISKLISYIDWNPLRLKVFTVLGLCCAIHRTNIFSSPKAVYNTILKGLPFIVSELYNHMPQKYRYY
jgi:hypothetical protein